LENHTVKSADILSKIAKHFGLALNDLLDVSAQINGGNKIHPEKRSKEFNFQNLAKNSRQKST
jgi:LysM repeat protein